MNRKVRIHTLIASAIVIVSSVSVAAQQPVRASANNSAAHPVTSSRSTITLTAPAPGGPNARPTARQRTPITEAELLSGIDLSDDQRRAIDQIHHDMKAKMEIVAKDSNESPEQKAAMLEGMNRMQLREVFDVLKPEQRDQVRKKINAMRAASRQDEKRPSEQKTH